MNMKLTIPNCLTLFRFALIPAVAVSFTSGHIWLSLALFVAAGITDLLDGYIARKTNTITNFGQIADPLADKLMVITTLTVFHLKGNLPWYFLAIYTGQAGVLFSGSIAVLLGKMSGKMKEVEVKSQFVGKISAALAFVGIALSFFSEQTFPWNEIVLWAGIAGGIATIICYALYATRAKMK